MNPKTSTVDAEGQHRLHDPLTAGGERREARAVEEQRHQHQLRRGVGAEGGDRGEQRACRARPATAARPTDRRDQRRRATTAAIRRETSPSSSSPSRRPPRPRRSRQQATQVPATVASGEPEGGHGVVARRAGAPAPGAGAGERARHGRAGRARRSAAARSAARRPARRPGPRSAGVDRRAAAARGREDEEQDQGERGAVAGAVGQQRPRPPVTRGTEPSASPRVVTRSVWPAAGSRYAGECAI